MNAKLSAVLVPGWRTRFAPAPTGHLHLGHVVNAVWVWSTAQAFGGEVIVRIEDHDRQRSRPEFETSILTDLAWLGLRPPDAPAPFRQSDHTDAYATALAALEDAALAYACSCSRKDIAGRSDMPPDAEVAYPGTCRHARLDPQSVAGRRALLVDTPIIFEDLRHGRITQNPARQCGDVLLRDRLGQWTYQFAVVVDDRRHAIDLVIRGDDLLSSTGRQIALAAMLGRRDPPLFLHHPLVLHPDGRKLSKAAGDTSLAALRDAGWTPERMLGHAAWLGGLQSAQRDIGAHELGRLWV